jgi:hypothetical protein
VNQHSNTLKDGQRNFGLIEELQIFFCVYEKVKDGGSVAK